MMQQRYACAHNDESRTGKFSNNNKSSTVTVIYLLARESYISRDNHELEADFRELSFLQVKHSTPKIRKSNAT